VKVLVEIDCAGAAFDDADAEVARILRGAAAVAECNVTLRDGWSLRDVNGNTCGSVRVIHDG
jgi:hypothetical protein